MQKQKNNVLKSEPQHTCQERAMSPFSKAPDAPRAGWAGSERKRQLNCSWWKMVTTLGTGGLGVLQTNKGRSKKGKMRAWQHGGSRAR